MGHELLRPIERVILRLTDEGHTPSEIARRVNKKPGTVHRILVMITMRDGNTGSTARDSEVLRPVERVIVKLRARGESYGEIGNRLARSGAQVRRIESMARIKLEG